MKIQSQVVKYGVKSSVYLGLVLLIFISMGAGCASTRKTTTTETTVEYPNKEDSQIEEKSIDEPNQTVVEKSTTTTTTTETKPEHRGIIGGVFHIIGSVISFPFIVIGGLLRMIF